MLSERVRIPSVPSDESFPALFMASRRLNEISDQRHALSMASTALESLRLSSPATIPFSSSSLHPTLVQSSFASSNIAAIILRYFLGFTWRRFFVSVRTCSQTFFRVSLYNFFSATSFHSTNSVPPRSFRLHEPFLMQRTRFSSPPHAFLQVSRAHNGCRFWIDWFYPCTI